jgi:hypothetical protein
LAKALQANPNLQDARAMLEDLNKPQSATANATPAAPLVSPPELRLTTFEGR